MQAQATVLNQAEGRIAYRFHARDLRLDAGRDGVQVHLVGPLPPGAGDVPGPNPQARHRGSIQLPCGQRQVSDWWQVH